MNNYTFTISSYGVWDQRNHTPRKLTVQADSIQEAEQKLDLKYYEVPLIDTIEKL